MRESATLAREVEVMAIPYGDRIKLPAGSAVVVLQSLGGSYTLMTDLGYMVRLEGKDADSIGKEIVAAPAAPASSESSKSVEEQAWDQLRTCYDPEIPVNIVALGLVYSCEVTAREDGTYRIQVRFTLTAPGCGMGEVLKQDIEHKLRSIPGVGEVDVEVAFDPPWSQEMMSEEAKLQLGMM